MIDIKEKVETGKSLAG